MKMTLNQQNKSTIIISGPKNIKNEVLNKIVALLVLEMHLIVGVECGGHIEYRNLRPFQGTPVSVPVKNWNSMV